jgi:predicted ferric reductase
MQKKNIGNLAIASLVALNIILWLTFPPINDGRPLYTYQWIGEIMSTSGLILLASGIMLSTRARFLEPYFGGLDQMYQSHKKSAILAILFIFTHFFVVSIGRGVHLGISLGKIALIGLLISIILALSSRIPFIGGYIRLRYHHWKLIHKFTGLFLMVGILHHFQVQNLMQTTPIVRAYVLLISFSGAAVYLYKELLQGLLQKRHPFLVDEAKRLNGTVLEITLKPLKEKLAFQAGQFLFVSFASHKLLKEPHPFTISSSPKSDHLKLAIRTSGDFTQHLYDTLDAGTPAHVEGSYGMFNYKTGGHQQIWIAGGIGITPFMSWIRDFGEILDFEIDFFYSLRFAEEGLYGNEIKAALAKHDHFRAHIHLTNRDGRLNADKIIASSGPVRGKDIYLCGPVAMTEALRGQFLRAGASAGQIHFEEFNFR